MHKPQKANYIISFEVVTYQILATGLFQCYDENYLSPEDKQTPDNLTIRKHVYRWKCWPTEGGGGKI